MKKFLLTLFVIIVVAGVLGAVGFAGYRYGYSQGVSGTSNDNVIVRPFGRGDDFGWNRMPMHNFNNGMRPGYHQVFGMRGGMMPYGGGLLAPLFFLARVAVYAFLIWVVYKLLTGWRISFTQTNQKPIEPEIKND
jgi:hypothetical protein